MELKNGNTVALERRMDLASLFCMIGRHGPAVALAVVAVVSVLAAFIIYRIVRGKRRKAAAADGDRKSPGEERGASGTRPEYEPIREESLSSVESTDVSDEGSADTREADEVMHPKIRLRRVAAEEKKPRIDSREPDYKHATSDEVFKADYQEKENVTRDQDVTEEENLQAGSNTLMNSVEDPVNGTGDLLASVICDSKNNKFQEENPPDSINHSDCWSCSQHCVGEEKHETSGNETSTTDQDIDGGDAGGPAVEATTEILDKCHKGAGATFDTHPPAFDKQEEDRKAQISGVGKVLDLSETNTSVDNSDLPSVGTEIQHEKTETDPTVVLAGKTTDAKQQHSEACDKSSVPHDEKTSVAPVPEADENEAASTTTEDTGNSEAFEGSTVNSRHAAVYDNSDVAPAIMSKIISHPDTPFTLHDQPIDQMQNNDVCPDVTSGDVHSPLCKIHLLSFEQSELRDIDKDGSSSPGFGKESGISSLTVSPDLLEDCNGFNITGDDMTLPAADCDPRPEERTETQSDFFTDDAALSGSDDGAEGSAIGPYPSHLAQKAHRELADVTTDEATLGHKIEESYNSALDKFMAEIAESVLSFTSELKVKTSVRNVVEDKESKQGVTTQRKAEAEAERENEDYEKTEISIMEATMDNNEWIMDSNYQVLPWMNVSVSSFAQDGRQSSQPLPQCQRSSALDSTCPDADATLSTEVRQTSRLPLADDSPETSKKVLAVQPMPQNVNVTFRIHYLTHSPYQTVAVTGNQQELGNWKEFIPLERAKDGQWAAVVSLPAESHVEWKFVVVDRGQVCRWEECGNRLLHTGYGDDLTVHKWWGFL